MKASLRILALASGAILAAGAAACTVTTSNDGDAGNLFDDAGNASDTGTTSDGGTADTGVVDNAACRDFTLGDGGIERITFDTTSAACDTCMDDKCCALMEACFQDSTGQCQQLEACLSSCKTDSNPGECQQTCGDAFKEADGGANPTGDLHNAWSSCEQTNCSSACP